MRLVLCFLAVGFHAVVMSSRDSGFQKRLVVQNPWNDYWNVPVYSKKDLEQTSFVDRDVGSSASSQKRASLPYNGGRGRHPVLFRKDVDQTSFANRDVDSSESFQKRVYLPHHSGWVLPAVAFRKDVEGSSFVDRDVDSPERFQREVYREGRQFRPFRPRPPPPPPPRPPRPYPRLRKDVEGSGFVNRDVDSSASFQKRVNYKWSRPPVNFRKDVEDLETRELSDQSPSALERSQRSVPLSKPWVEAPWSSAVE